MPKSTTEPKKRVRRTAAPAANEDEENSDLEETPVEDTTTPIKKRVVHDDDDDDDDDEDDDCIIGDDDDIDTTPLQKTKSETAKSEMTFSEKKAYQAHRKANGKTYAQNETCGMQGHVKFATEKVSAQVKQKIMALTDSDDDQEIYDNNGVKIVWHYDNTGANPGDTTKKRKRRGNKALVASFDAVTTNQAVAAFELFVDAFTQLGLEYEPYDDAEVLVPGKYTARIQVYLNKKLKGEEVMIILGDSWLCNDLIKDTAKAHNAIVKFQPLKTSNYDGMAWIVNDRTVWPDLKDAIEPIGMIVKVVE